MDPVTDGFVKALLGAGPGGLIALGTLYLYRGRGIDLDRANAKVDELQAKIVTMLQAQLEGEPQRRQTLADITRAIADNTNLLRERLKV